MYKKYKDMMIGGILIVLSCTYLAMSFQIKLTNIDRIVGSRMFPQICGTVILVLSIWLTASGIQNAKKDMDNGTGERKNYIRTVIVLGSYAAYIFLMDKLGFAIASALYLFSQMIVMGKWPVRKKSLWLYLMISIVASGAIYVMFNKIFLLMLPKTGWF